MVDYWKYPRIPAGLVEFNRVANIAQLAGRQLMLTPGVVPWDFGSPMWRVERKTLGYPPDMMRQYLWITLAHPLDHLGLYGFGELERTGYVLYDLRRQLALSVERGEVELALPAAEAAVLALLPAARRAGIAGPHEPADEREHA